MMIARHRSSLSHWAKLLARLAFAALCLLLASPAHADLYVLSVGINDYRHLPKLEGAVSDAEDIIGAAVRAKARRAVLLRDGEASPERIRREWAALLGEARPGDSIVFTFAGYGGRERDKPPLDEPDGLDDAFLLSAFAPRPGEAGFADKLLDDDIHAMLRQAGQKPLRVIFVADTCHSGSLTRNFDPRLGVSLRSIPPYDENGAPPSSVLQPPADDGLDELGHVTFIAATKERVSSPEIPIEGKKRGALSYSFARALDGAADNNRDGKLSRQELDSHIRQHVLQLSEAKQAPDIRYPRGTGGEIVLAGDQFGETSISESAPARLRLAVINVSPQMKRALHRSLENVLLTEDTAGADLIWDASDKTVLTGLGDPAAHLVEASALQGVIDKWSALNSIKRLVVLKPLQIIVKPHDGQHREGDNIFISTAPLRHPHVSVLNIAPDGEVKWLYPQEADKPKWSTGMPFSLTGDNGPVVVTPPFGADHLIVIASAAPLADLARRLKGKSAVNLPDILGEVLDGVPYEIGLKGIYTTPGGRQ